MCCIVEIATFVLGIMALVKGEVSITSGKVVRGAPAYIIGVILMSTLPLAFGIGVLVGAVMAANGQDPAANPLQLAWIDPAITLTTVGVSFILAMIYGEDAGRKSSSKRRKKRREYEEEEYPEDDE